MLIDWFTVGVQIVNFLILIALLKHFLYGPIMRAMDEREQTIATRLSDTESARKEAEAKAALLAKEQDAFARSRARMELEAHQEINTWKEKSIGRIKDEITAQQSAWRQDLADEQNAFLQKLKIHISQQVFLVARKAMNDLADVNLEAQLLKTFLKKLHDEPGTPIEGNAPASAMIQVTTGFPLDASQKEMIQPQIDRSFPSFPGVDFQQDEQLGFGIRLVAGDQKWEWNLSRYLLDMEKEIINTMSMAVGKNE